VNLEAKIAKKGEELETEEADKKNEGDLKDEEDYTAQHQTELHLDAHGFCWSCGEESSRVGRSEWRQRVPGRDQTISAGERGV